MRIGYIKLHRRVLDGGWLQNPDLWCFWCWCLLKASHKVHYQTVGLQRVKLEQGQFVFGRKAAAAELKISEQRVRTLLSKLIEWQNLTIKPTNKFSIVTIVNWEFYQVNDSATTSNPTNDQPTTNQQLTTNKNVKKDKNVKNDNKLLCEFDIARKLFKGKKNGLNPEWENFTRKHSSYHSIVPLLLPAIEREIVWRESAGKIDGYFVPQWKNFQTWINNSCWTQEFPEIAHEETLEEFSERMDDGE